MTPDLSKTLDPTGKSVFDVIIDEHRLVEKLYAGFQQGAENADKQIIVHNLIKLLSMHAACEEMALYPVMKTKLPNGPQLVQHALAEHLQVKRLLFDLDNMLVGQSGFDDKVHECLKDVLQHVKEEETDLLPSLQQACTPAEVTEVTAMYLSVKNCAPTRPHPDAPNEPPTNKAANIHALSMDSVRDAGRFSAA